MESFKSHILVIDDDEGIRSLLKQFLNDKGKKIFEEIFLSQKKRIYKALLNSSSKEVINFELVLKRIIDGKF